MAINAGDRVSFRLMPNATPCSAVVVFVDDAVIALDPLDDGSLDVPPGRHVLIAEAGSDMEYYGEVLGKEGPALRLRRLWTGKRGYFRVDDVFPVRWRVVREGEPLGESRVFTAYGFDATGPDVPDEGVSPRLWKILADMNAKLGLILEHLNLESQGLIGAGSIPVNISASGMRFALDGAVKMGDVLEVKMLLPASPPAGLCANGRVVRMEKRDDGAHDASLQFLDLEDDVREVIIQYTLQRQREFMRRQRLREEDR